MTEANPSLSPSSVTTRSGAARSFSFSTHQLPCEARRSASSMLVFNNWPEISSVIHSHHFAWSWPSSALAVRFQPSTFEKVVATTSLRILLWLFVTVDAFKPPTLRASGDTLMGTAVQQGLDLLRGRKSLFKEGGAVFSALALSD